MLFLLLQDFKSAAAARFSKSKKEKVKCPGTGLRTASRLNAPDFKSETSGDYFTGSFHIFSKTTRIFLYAFSQILCADSGLERPKSMAMSA